MHDIGIRVNHKQALVNTEMYEAEDFRNVSVTTNSLPNLWNNQRSLFYIFCRINIHTHHYRFVEILINRILNSKAIFELSRVKLEDALETHQAKEKRL